MSLFITLEGPEGSGKTSAIKIVKETLENEGYQIVMTREPGGTPISEQIRNVILDKNNTAMDYRTEALLYAASRRQHLVEKVLPALKEDTIVLCDRFVDSSLVYQGVGRGLGIDTVYQMNLFAIDDVMPNLTIFFDVKPEIGLSRIHKDENREVNRLDLETLEFHQKVYNGYCEVAKHYSDRIQSVDASKDIESVYNDVLEMVKAKL